MSSCSRKVVAGSTMSAIAAVRSEEHTSELQLQSNLVCRLLLGKKNASDAILPLHLHRHSFALTRMARKPTARILNGAVTLGGSLEAAVDSTAASPGPTLFLPHL